MVHARKIPLHKLRIPGLKQNGLPRRGVHAHILRKRRIAVLIRLHPVRGVHIERHLQIPPVKLSQKAHRIRKQLRIPCVAGPARSILRGHIGQMPVHVNDRDGKRNILLRKTVHQGEIGLLRIPVIPAPPVSKRILWQQRNLSRQAVKILKAAHIIPSIPEKVEITGRCVLSLLNPARLCDQQRTAIVQQRPPLRGEDAALQRNTPVRLIKRPRRPLKVIRPVPVIPHGGKRVKTTGQSDAQTGRRKLFLIVFQPQTLRDDRKLLLRLLHLKFRQRKIPVHHRLCRAVGKYTVPAVLHPDQRRGQHRKTIRLPPDHRLRARHTVSFPITIHCTFHSF